ncbi:MAG: LamG domain-containing protein [Gammaproteobacteria bacterium]|nr:LamG domain-containing protein [Gammaproteobacteria bacterium]
MKTLLKLFVALGLSLGLLGNAYAGLNDGLVAYYPFNGNANDESGNGHNGTVNGATLTTDRFGIIESAYGFDGVDDYIKASASNLPTAERTVSLWFYANTVANKPGLFGYGGGICGTTWFMGINNTGNGDVQNTYQMQAHCNIDRIGSSYLQEPVGNWYHWLVATSTNGTKMYVNGVEVASNNNFIKNTIVNGADIGIGVVPSSKGVVPYVDLNISYFSGIIDDIRIYNRALPESEIQQLYDTNGSTAEGIAQCQADPASCNITFTDTNGSTVAGILQCQTNPENCGLYGQQDLANSYADGVTKGENNVTTTPNNYGLHTSAELVAAEETGIKKVTDNPHDYGLHTATELAAAEQTGIDKVIATPNGYGLHTAAELTAAKQTSIDKVKAAPNDYGLHSAAEFAVAEQTGMDKVKASPNDYGLYTEAELTASFDDGKTQGRGECIDDPASCGISVTLPLQKEYTLTPARIQPQVIMAGINPSLVHHSDTQFTILAVVRPGAVSIDTVMLALGGNTFNYGLTSMSTLQNGDQIWGGVFPFAAGSFGTTDYPIVWGKEPGQFAIHVMDTGGQISAIFPTLKFGNYPEIDGQ